MERDPGGLTVRCWGQINDVWYGLQSNVATNPKDYFWNLRPSYGSTRSGSTRRNYRSDDDAILWNTDPALGLQYIGGDANRLLLITNRRECAVRFETSTREEYTTK